jgi:hypothetical protein
MDCQFAFSICIERNRVPRFLGRLVRWMEDRSRKYQTCASRTRAISIATEHKIAILGLDAMEVQKDGLATVYLADASAYIRYTGDWNAYVTKMNTEADSWLREHRLGENQGYILSSASETEFRSLSNKTR